MAEVSNWRDIAAWVRENAALVVVVVACMMSFIGLIAIVERSYERHYRQIYIECRGHGLSEAYCRHVLRGL